MAEFELGIFSSPFIPEAVRERVTGMLRRLPEGKTFIDIIPPTHSRWKPFPRRIIVAGGDGSVREILQWMQDRGEVRPVGLMAGGSQNVLYHALMELGLKTSINTFLEKNPDDYPEDQRLKPGMVGDLVFVNHAGLGRFEQHLGEFNRRLRLLRNGQRPFVCALFSLAASLNPNGRKDFLNLYTITPTIGQLRAFPEQKLLGNGITHAKVSSVRGLVQTMIYWQRGQSAPNRAMHQSTYTRFEDTTGNSSIWLDGDTSAYPRQAVLITRTPYGIPVVAIT